MHPNGLIGFGGYDGYGADLPVLPAQLTPITQADLDAQLAARDKKNLQLTIMVGVGSAVCALGLALWLGRR